MVKEGTFIEWAKSLDPKRCNTEMSVMRELAARLAAVEEEFLKLLKRIESLEKKVG